MRSKSGLGWRLFGANRRQATGFRQCWIAREILGLPLVFAARAQERFFAMGIFGDRIWRRLQTIMMRMPLAMLRAKNRPDENPWRNHEKSAEINKGLSNAGSGGNQRPNRILLIYTEYTGQ